MYQIAVSDGGQWQPHGGPFATEGEATEATYALARSLPRGRIVRLVRPDGGPLLYVASGRAVRREAGVSP